MKSDLAGIQEQKAFGWKIQILMNIPLQKHIHFLFDISTEMKGYFPLVYHFRIWVLKNLSPSKSQNQMEIQNHQNNYLLILSINQQAHQRLFLEIKWEFFSKANVHVAVQCHFTAAIYLYSSTTQNGFIRFYFLLCHQKADGQIIVSLSDLKYKRFNFSFESFFPSIFF